MSLPDSAHSAALDEQVIKPVWFAWLDIDGDPVWANTSGRNITPAGTGDPDLDGNEFIGISGELVEVSSVKVKTSGSESVTAELSGIPGLDDDALALLADPSAYRGRCPHGGSFGQDLHANPSRRPAGAAPRGAVSGEVSNRQGCAPRVR